MGALDSSIEIPHLFVSPNFGQGGSCQKYV